MVPLIIVICAWVNWNLPICSYYTASGGEGYRFDEDFLLFYYNEDK